jgi:hypothetical protein
VVLKRQWQILGGKGCEYSIETQIDLFCALVGLYNFGKQCGEALFEEEAIDIEGSREEEEAEGVGGTGNTWMNQKRDAIAAAMWKDYQFYIQNSR